VEGMRGVTLIAKRLSVARKLGWGAYRKRGRVPWGARETYGEPHKPQKDWVNRKGSTRGNGGFGQKSPHERRLTGSHASKKQTAKFKHLRRRPGTQQTHPGAYTALGRIGRNRVEGRGRGNRVAGGLEKRVWVS